MNFSPKAKAWITLISLVLSTGVGVGLAAHATGASVTGAILVGISTAATNVYHAMTASPKEKAQAGSTNTRPPMGPGILG